MKDAFFRIFLGDIGDIYAISFRSPETHKELMPTLSSRTGYASALEIFYENFNFPSAITSFSFNICCKCRNFSIM